MLLALFSGVVCRLPGFGVRALTLTFSLAITPFRCTNVRCWHFIDSQTISDAASDFFSILFAAFWCINSGKHHVPTSPISHETQLILFRHRSEDASARARTQGPSVPVLALTESKCHYLSKDKAVHGIMPMVRANT